MVEYKCILCNKKLPENYLRKRVHCPYCGSKIIFKPRTVKTTHLAR